MAKSLETNKIRKEKKRKNKTMSYIRKNINGEKIITSRNQKKDLRKHLNKQKSE